MHRASDLSSESEMRMFDDEELHSLSYPKNRKSSQQFISSTLRSGDKSLLADIKALKKKPRPAAGSKYEASPYLNIEKDVNTNAFNQHRSGRRKIRSNMSKDFLSQYRDTLTSLEEKKPDSPSKSKAAAVTRSL